MAKSRFPLALLRRSVLYREIERLFAGRPDPRRQIDGLYWSTRIAGEDSISIETLLDANTLEWRWLRR